MNDIPTPEPEYHDNPSFELVWEMVSHSTDELNLSGAPAFADPFTIQSIAWRCLHPHTTLTVVDFRELLLAHLPHYVDPTHVGTCRQITCQVRSSILEVPDVDAVWRDITVPYCHCGGCGPSEQETDDAMQCIREMGYYPLHEVLAITIGEGVTPDRHTSNVIDRASAMLHPQFSFILNVPHGDATIINFGSGWGKPRTVSEMMGRQATETVVDEFVKSVDAWAESWGKGGDDS